MAYLNIVIICQAVDENDPIQATTVRWIRVLAQKEPIKMVTVLALRVGEYRLPANTLVYQIGGSSSFFTLLNFYSYVIKKVFAGEADCFFIYQGGPYPLLLMPFKILWGKNIYQWKAHPHITPMMKFYTRYCDTVVFTSTANAFPLRLPNVKIIGQGVDIAAFDILPQDRKYDLMIVGRIAPVKNLDTVVHTLAYVKAKYGLILGLNIYGPVFAQDRRYKEYIDDLIQKSNLSDSVIFHGPVKQDALPEIFNSHKILINFSSTALDRVVVEAMACGLPVFSTNSCVREVIPDSYKDILTITGCSDYDVLAQKIHHLLSISDEDRREIGRILRETIVSHHSDEVLFDKIISEIKNHEK